MDTELEPIRRARGQFAAMSCTYFLGVFNDNFFKQAALVLAVAAGRPSMQGYAVAAFTVPFIVFAAPAGWLADRFPKRTVVIGAKWTEFLAMLFGAAGVCCGNWFLIFAMLGTMGMQATVFSPALNGSIPELYPASYVTRANGLLRMIITAAILTGVALAGIALDRQGAGLWNVDRGRLAVAATVMGVALFGLLVSYGVPRRPAADPRVPFPWKGPLHTLQQLAATRKDPLLAVTIAANVFIWFVGSLEILLINPLGIQQFGLSKSMTSCLVASELIGLSVGGLISGRFVTIKRWFRIMGPVSLLMSLVMIGMVLVPSAPARAQLPLLYALTLLLGLTGGIVLIPMESFIQVRPAPERKGAVLSAVNFVVFTGILLSGFISNFMNAHWAPTFGFGVLGTASGVISLALLLAYRRQEARA